MIVETIEELKKLLVDTGVEHFNKGYQMAKAELEKQITEKDLRIEELESQFGYECDCNSQFIECQKENDQLKQQLAEKEKEVDNLYNRLNSKQKFYEMNLEKDYKEYLSRLDKLEKQCDKDKISFAVEQLNQAKGKIQHNILFVNCDDYVNVIEEIDNQIKQLKEMK